MKERNSNFELMRIVSMLLIVLCHLINFGGLVQNCTNPSLKIIFEVLMFATLVHVNSYVLVSGYFQSKSKFKFSKLLKMFFQVVFYLLVILIVSIKIGWIKDYNIMTFVNNVLPSCISNYWFINMYIIMYAFSDYINKFINSLSRNQHKRFLIVGFLIFALLPFVSGRRFLDNTGYNFYSFIYLYILGAYLRLYPLKETYHFKRMSTNGYRIFLIIIFITMFLSNYFINYFAFNINGMSNIFSEISSRILATKFDYSTPFVIIQTIVYFEFFKTFTLKSKLINIVSKYTLGVYLLHENAYVREHLYTLLKINNGLYGSYKKIIAVLIAMIMIFVVGIIVDFIRELLEKLLLKIKPIKWLKNKFKNFVNSFNFKIEW